MRWAHKPVPAGSLFQQVLLCPGLVHDARIVQHWPLPEATPASQVTPHSITHNYSTWCWELVTITYSGPCLRWHKLAVNTVAFNMGYQCIAKMNATTLDSSEHAQEISEFMSIHTYQRPIQHKYLCKQPWPSPALPWNPSAVRHVPCRATSMRLEFCPLDCSSTARFWWTDHPTW